MFGRLSHTFLSEVVLKSLRMVAMMELIYYRISLFILLLKSIIPYDLTHIIPYEFYSLLRLINYFPIKFQAHSKSLLK